MKNFFGLWKKKMFGFYFFDWICFIADKHTLCMDYASLISVSCLWRVFWQVSDGLSGCEGRDDDYTTQPSLLTPLMTYWGGWHLADQDITLDNYWWQWITLTAALAPAHTGATLRYSEIKTQDSPLDTGRVWSVVSLLWPRRRLRHRDRSRLRRG